MKQFLTLVLFTLSTGHFFAQTDKNGNPVFNSVSTTEKQIGDCLLSSNYYTLKNNIDNKHSSVYISEHPVSDQIETAAINLPSNFYTLTKHKKIVVMILLQHDPKREFMVIEMLTHKQSTFPCKLTGDITEDRANEIIRAKYDSTATIDNGKLRLNGKEFKIILNREIEDAVTALIKAEKLHKLEPSDITMPSKSDVKAFILSETKEGGKLDFFTPIKGKEYDGLQIKPGLFTTQQGVALYKWGRACFEIGVNTAEDALAIFAEFKGKPLSERDIDYIRMGFNKEWEQ
jgi:hypothetical protein